MNNLQTVNLDAAKAELRETLRKEGLSEEAIARVSTSTAKYVAAVVRIERDRAKVQLDQQRASFEAIQRTRQILDTIAGDIFARRMTR